MLALGALSTGCLIDMGQYLPQLFPFLVQVHPSSFFFSRYLLILFFIPPRYPPLLFPLVIPLFYYLSWLYSFLSSLFLHPLSLLPPFYFLIAFSLFPHSLLLFFPLFLIPFFLPSTSSFLLPLPSPFLSLLHRTSLTPLLRCVPSLVGC